ncbi:class I SAM-dependent methyltransferase [Candidatus Saccharibacteria bacterium]|nr:MAG: class I SAM-dependent methyltransferase [Candidatus Saccharibacteria bacterium]
MAKSGEKSYFKEIGEAGINYTLAKPFSDPPNLGSLLHDIAAVFSLLPPPPARILDLGCGSGWTSAFFARAGYDVVGVDISPEAVEAASKHYLELPNVSFVVGDYDTLAYSGEFDAAVFFDSLHHAEDEVLALKAAFVALRPGGILVACEPGVGHSKTAKSIDAMERYGVNERDMPPKLLRIQMRKAGFSTIKTYAYPAISHRALYFNRTGWIGRLRNIAMVRALTVGMLATILRRNHGIVVAHREADT